MSVPLHVFRGRLRHALGPGSSYLTTVEVEALDQDEAMILMIAAVHSKYAEFEGFSIRFEHEPACVTMDIDPEDYSRFAVGEIVLAANHLNILIDPLPAYTVWELREIESIPSGGPYLWADKEKKVVFVGMTPYGVRKVEFLD